MDFFERQDQARRKTKWLVLYFVICVALTVVAVYLPFGLMVVKFRSRHQHFFNPDPSHPPVLGIWNAGLFFDVAVVTLIVVTAGSLYKIVTLSRGGSVVATALGGRPLGPHPNNPNELKLRNVVEEMAIASGVPVPEIYVLDDEPGINAFAAGHSTSDATIGVTRGAIELLDREQLQGVIAHEFSHILNGDMRLNLRLMGWVFGILCIAYVGYMCLRVRSSGRDRGTVALVGLALLIIGGIGLFFGKLIKAAVSRQREFLADAAAVQFTRNPGGLAGALKKIGGAQYGSRLESGAAEEASHMFFGNGLGESWLNLLATHPPLEERIRLLDSAFDGRFQRVELPIEAASIPASASPIPAAAKPQAQIPPPKPQAQIRPPQLSDLMGGARTVATSSALVNVGAAMPAHVIYAGALMAALPAPFMAAAREPFSATAIAYALLLSPDAQIRAAQFQTLGSMGEQPALREALKFRAEIERLDQKLKLPLIELSLPALRQLSPAQYDEFKKNVKILIETDGEIDLFEYAFQKMLFRHLDPHFTRARKPVVQYYALRGLAGECSVLVSALSHVGHDDPAQIEKAFHSGATALELPDVHLIPMDQCTLEQLDSALDRLAQTTPQCKKLLLQACAQTVSADGIIQISEAELLRAIADTLDCPMPPFIQT
jgi:Zn-dependent protease with chaperone function